MNKDKINLLTKNQLTFLIIGFALGPAFLRLPNAIVPIAKQDAWISAIIALIYPIYILVIANYIIYLHPKENLMILSKMYYGNILGILFNSIFLFQVMFYTCVILIDFSTVSRIYMVAFLTPTKVILMTIFLIVYACNSGLKVISQATVFISFMLLFLIALSMGALKEGSILNIQPILSSGLKNTFLATKEVAYFYTGFEFLLLYHPFAKDKKDIKYASIWAIIISGIIWTWSVFITIYYLGIDMIPKSFYSYFLTFDAVKLPILNSFRYIAMFIWTLVSFRIITIYYFSTSFILNTLTNISTKKLNLLLSPLVFFLTLYAIEIVFSKEQLMFMSKSLVVFNIIFLSLLSLIIFIKSKSKK